MAPDGRGILVTAGAGSIGSSVVRGLLDCSPEFHVVTLDALTHGGLRAGLADLVSVVVDVSDAGCTETLFGVYVHSRGPTPSA